MKIFFNDARDIIESIPRVKDIINGASGLTNSTINIFTASFGYTSNLDFYEMLLNAKYEFDVGTIPDARKNEDAINISAWMPDIMPFILEKTKPGMIFYPKNKENEYELY